MRVGLVVERRYLLVAGRAVHADRLGERVVGLQPQDADAARRGPVLQFGEQPPAQPEPANGGGDPHALHVRVALAETQGAAADRVLVQPRDQQQPGRRGQLRVGGRDAAVRVEPAVEPAGQLREVRPHDQTRVRLARVGLGDPDHRRDEQPLDLGHGGYEPVALGSAQRFEDRRGQVVRAPVQFPPLGQPGRGEPGPAYPRVHAVGVDHDQPVGRELA